MDGEEMLLCAGGGRRDAFLSIIYSLKRKVHRSDAYMGRQHT